MPRTIILLLSLLAIPLAAHADQEPGKHTGRLVYVRQEGSTTEVPGNLLELGPDTIAILTHGKYLELPLDSIERVQVAGDSLKNGAVIGAAILGGWCAVICGQANNNPAFWFSAVAINAGLGAFIGTGIDAAHQGRTTIYRQTSSPKRIAVQYGFRW